MDDDGGSNVTRQCAEIVGIAGKHDGMVFGGDKGDVRVDHIGEPDAAEKVADRVALIGAEWLHIAAAEEAVQLRLAGAPTGLRDDGRSRHRNCPLFQTGTMISPDRAVVAIGGDQYAGVVDDGHADRRGALAPNSLATRCRASSISRSVSGAFSSSHSDTAFRPSWIRRARRAALVIHAETLRPESAAAARIPA